MLFLLISLSFALAYECDYPNFYSGHLNITTEKQFRDLMKKEKLFILALSAKWCTHCCKIETSLVEALPEIEKKGLKLVRADLSTQTYFNKIIEKSESLPHIYIVYNNELKRFDGQVGPSLFTFIEKFSNPHQILSSVEEIDDFFSSSPSISLAMVGFIFDTSEDYLKIYQNFAINLLDWPYTKFGLVTDKFLIKSLHIAEKYILYLNSLVIYTNGEFKSLDLEMDTQLLPFVARNTLKVLDELTPFTFQIYRSLSLPMLVMFIDKENPEHYKYIEIYERIARDSYGDIGYLWMDGKQPNNAEKKRAVGIITDKLPALAFNLLDGRVFPFDETKEITKKSISIFIENFRNNKLESGAHKGLRTKSGELENKYKNTPYLKYDELEEKVLSEGTDVMLLIYDSRDEKSLGIAPNYNKVALRYSELNIPSIKIYRSDIVSDPVQTKLGTYIWPAIIFLPAFHKVKPYVQYTGEAKAVQLMFFAQKYADIKFELPELPHLSPDQIQAYWQQVNELDEEKREKVSAANERRNWDEYF
ncbi:hypothetical protein SteCoe_1551 [Stentor coeruleus]|uniref:protein disulfide-isomerase n=1 Tax=Stentor coeruleus TaxID=5963 RepID=A0A1R2D1P2_9CILI|nr:hypothetical protein SteCoe_1551 [Stentor coeruleus]